MALHGNPDKKLLMRALARRRENNFDSFFEHLMTELFITGAKALLCIEICNQHEQQRTAALTAQLSAAAHKPAALEVIQFTLTGQTLIEGCVAYTLAP